MNAPSQLKRSLGIQLVVVVVIANIIGSGVYKKVAPMMDALHSSGWVLISWVLAGIITLFGALANAEIAGLLADTGGEYVYYKKIYNKFFSFIFGWSLFTVIQTAGISALCYIFAESLNSIIHLPPILNSWSNISIGEKIHPFAQMNVKLLAIFVIILLTWINNKGLKAGTGVSTAILILVFTGIFTIVVFGLGGNHANLEQPFVMKTTDASTVSVSAVFTAMMAAFWAYQGWASIGYVGGEVKDAKRNIPKGIVIGVFAIIAIYLLANITYLALLSPERIEQIHQTTRPGSTVPAQITAVEAVRVFWGSYGAIFISLLICFTTLGSANATVLSSGRIYYAMAIEGMFFKKVALLNKAAVPANSMIYQAVWACVLVLSGTFDQLTDMIIFAVFIYYGATTLGVFILRKKMPDAPRPYKVWGYPFVPAIVVLFSAVLVFNAFYSRPGEAAIGIGLMLTGVPMYQYFLSKKRKEGIQE